MTVAATQTRYAARSAGVPRSLNGGGLCRTTTSRMPWARAPAAAAASRVLARGPYARCNLAQVTPAACSSPNAVLMPAASSPQNSRKSYSATPLARPGHTTADDTAGAIVPGTD